MVSLAKPPGFGGSKNSEYLTTYKSTPDTPSQPALTPVYVQNIATTDISNAHAQTRLLLKQLKFQVKHIHNIDFLPGKRTEFLVDSNYHDAMVSRLRSLKFTVLDNFNPLTIRQSHLSDTTIDKIIEAEARRIAKGVSCSPNEIVQDYFVSLAKQIQIPSFVQHYQKHIKIFQDSYSTCDVSPALDE